MVRVNLEEVIFSSFHKFTFNTGHSIDGQIYSDYKFEQFVSLQARRKLRLREKNLKLHNLRLFLETLYLYMVDEASDKQLFSPFYTFFLYQVVLKNKEIQEIVISPIILPDGTNQK